MMPVAAEADPWADWVLGRRQGGEATPSGGHRERLNQFRDTVLAGADIQDGDVVLDLGCGDGLIGLAAAERVGESGAVILSDISERLLDHCRRLSEELGVSSRCRFLRASADDLSELADQSVDVVTDRSVLIYVEDKAKVFSEAFRVLRHRGRLSCFEPINRFVVEHSRPGHYSGYDLSAVADLAARVYDAYTQRCQGDAMMGFDERDLIRFADKAGFAEIVGHLRLSLLRPFPQDAEMLLHSSPNPLAPTLDEAISMALDEHESERFLAAFRSAVADRRGRLRFAGFHLRARKD